MPGQDSSLVLVPEIVSDYRDSVYIQVFETSTRAETLISPEHGMVIVQKLANFHPTWFFLYLFVLLGLFAWIRIYYGNILSQTVQASTNFQVAAKMFKDKSLLQNQLDNILYAFYFLSLAYFLFFLEERMEMVPYNLHGVLLYLFNLAILSGIFLVRVVLVNLLGTLFNQRSLFREYLYHTFIFNKLLGVSILTLLLFVVYTGAILQDIFFWASLVTILVVMIMRIIRGLIFSFKKDISIFYMFCYLCALEIVPLALLYRWLEGVL
jgi:hypothetical protein